MKTAINGAFAALTIALVTAPAAQAGTVGQAGLGERVSVSGRGVASGQDGAGMGVRFTERTTVTRDGKGQDGGPDGKSQDGGPDGKSQDGGRDGKSTLLQRRTGVFQFGKDGIAAWDISSRPGNSPDMPTDLFSPRRTIRIGITSYVSGGSYGKRLPQGKTWYRTDQDLTDASGQFGQIVNVAEPATLGTLLRSAKNSGSTYSGTVTFGELAAISHWFRTTLPVRADDKTTVTFKLTLDRDRHPRRLTTSWAATGVVNGGGWEGKTVGVETRFSGWGGKVTVKAPPASAVSTKLASGGK
ncbi:hypothetical protein [Streptosporangium sp. NPDC051022]|uniref:hypothetical protein n=1 Tax=Streptosporangium sp. NPDC051022 TaxID=3155752 RepID=UPI00341F7A88